MIAQILAIVYFAAIHVLPIPSTQSGTAPDAQVRESVVIGRAGNPEDARKNARQTALDQAVGALVDAETRIGKGAVLEEVISASAGFIEKFEVLEEGATRDGGHYVRARVEVRANLLKQRLVEAKVISAKVDGESIVAQALSKSASAEEAGKYLEKNLRDYPLRAMAVKLVSGPEVLDDTTDVWSAGIKVEVSLDKTGWESAVRTMRDALSVVATEKFTWRCRGGESPRLYGPRDPRVDVGRAAWVSLNENYSFNDLASEVQRLIKSERISPTQAVVSVPTEADWTADFEAFVVPRSIVAEFARLISNGVRLEVGLVDADGQRLKSWQVPMDVGPLPGRMATWMENAGRSRWEYHEAGPEWIDAAQPELYKLTHIAMTDVCLPRMSPCLVMPPNLHVGSYAYGPAVTLRIAFDVPKDIIGNTKSVTLKLQPTKRSFTYKHTPRGGSGKQVEIQMGGATTAGGDR